MDASFVKEIKDSQEVKTFEINGNTYCTDELNQVLPLEPPFPTVELGSLDGVVDYVKDNKDDAVTARSQLVCTHSTVELVSEPMGIRRQRDCLVQASAGATFDGIGKWMDQESFRVWMMTQFVGSEDGFDLLLLISKITDENIQLSEDNGISQTVTARVGIAPQSGVKVPSPIKLRPIRTFEEIEQPEGTFVYRLRKSQSGKGGMEMALFEVATNWKRTAALAARDYLKAKLPDVTVLA